MHTIPNHRQSKTGIAPGAMQVLAHPLNKEERIRLWFINPLKRMSGHDGFIALITSLPLLERIIRYRCKAIDNDNLNFSEGSILLKELASFLQLSEANALLFWGQFRNGLLHRAMVKPVSPYQLDPYHPGPPVEVNHEGIVLINVWVLRDTVVKQLEHHGTKLWRDDGYPIPDVYIEAAARYQNL